MKDKIKFRFNQGALFKMIVSCKHCAFASSFEHNCEACPVLRYSYNIGVAVTDSDSSWIGSNVENIFVITDNPSVARNAYNQCKRLAAECVHNNARKKAK